jgi:hypothetical protein
MGGEEDEEYIGGTPRVLMVQEDEEDSQTDEPCKREVRFNEALTPLSRNTNPPSSRPSRDTLAPTRLVPATPPGLAAGRTPTEGGDQPTGPSEEVWLGFEHHERGHRAVCRSDPAQVRELYELGMTLKGSWPQDEEAARRCPYATLLRGPHLAPARNVPGSRGSSASA